MACQAVQQWSLSGLMAAFLDLAIAYLLLCASAVAYLVSKFLGFLGLSLPCPCDGLFFNTNLCFNRLLIDSPTQIVSDVQYSVKHRFPFNGPKSYTICGSNSVNGIFEVEGEGSCSSVSNEKYDVKGKGVMSHRRQKRGDDHGEYSSGLNASGLIVGGSLAVDNGDDDDDDDAHYLEYNKRSPTLRELRQRSLTSVQTSQYPEQDIHINKEISSNDESKYTPKVAKSFSEDEKNTIRILEQALEEEQIARAALYIDLEKERNAAATAADEAMAMILRLQEEKASIEMEARQYQRILEEKSAYEAEEMNILKEILVRRETEINFLEKEVEAYKKMMSVENEEFGVSVDPNDDPVQILHQLIASTNKKYERSNMHKQGDSDEQLQEKEMILVDNNLHFTSGIPQENQFLEKNSPLEGKSLDQIEEMNLGAEKIIETCNLDVILDKDANVYDVHVIGDEINFRKGEDLSEICSVLQPKGPRGLLRNSTSALDSEMRKIDNEVGGLLERLKLVQEGRETLGIPLENREMENVQLPLITTKGFSKKRRCRSVSSGF